MRLLVGLGAGQAQEVVKEHGLPELPWFENDNADVDPIDAAAFHVISDLFAGMGLRSHPNS